MDLQNTKATAPLNIVAPWKKWVRALTIAEDSKGWNSETRASHHLTRQNWRVLARNVECFHVQIDILARDPNGLLHIVEVKSQSQRKQAHLPWRQFQRLIRASQILAEYEPVEITLALVGSEGIQLLPVDALTPP